MEVAKALRAATDEAGWSPVKLAAEVGVTEAAARRWLSGQAEPRLGAYQILRRVLPRFADLVDGTAA